MNYYIENNGLEQMLIIFVPHAIFEIPAILLSASIGFLLIIFVVEKGNNHQKYAPYKFNLLYIIKSILIIIVLLGIAAFIESHFSMKVN